MTKPITRFRDEYDFLSNFYPAAVSLDGLDYPTVEHAFQAAKVFDEETRRKIREAKTPNNAKALGRQDKRREDWFDVSLQIMENLVRQKFTRYPELRKKLLAAGDAELIEGNTWNDRFYGCVWDKKREQWVGENHLGKILSNKFSMLNCSDNGPYVMPLRVRLQLTPLLHPPHALP